MKRKDDFDIQIKDSVKTNQVSILNRFSPKMPRRLFLKKFNKSNSVAVLLFNRDNNNMENQCSKIQKELIKNEAILYGNDNLLKLKQFKKSNHKEDQRKNWSSSSSSKNLNTKSIDNELLPKFDRNLEVPSISNIPFTNSEILASFQALQIKEMSSLSSPINDYFHHHSIIKLKQRTNEGDILKETSHTKQLTNFYSYSRVNSESHSLNNNIKDHTNTYYNHYGLEKGQEIASINKKHTDNTTCKFTKTKELSPEYLATKKKIQIILKRKTSGDKSS